MRIYKDLKCKNCGKKIIKNPHESYKQYYNRINCSVECQANARIGKPFTGKYFSTHNKTNTRIYKIWSGIKNRCNNKKNCAYREYGGRGISVCNDWNSFEIFYNDMYESYVNHCKEFGEKNTTIDRIDNNGNYSKENCRWATYKEQGKNKRNNRLLTYRGETKTLSEWAKNFNILYNTLFSRINIYDYDVEKALTSPIKRKNYGKN